MSHDDFNETSSYSETYNEIFDLDNMVEITGKPVEICRSVLIEANGDLNAALTLIFCGDDRNNDSSSSSSNIHDLRRIIDLNDSQQSQEIYFKDIPGVSKEICLLLSLPAHRFDDILKIVSKPDTITLRPIITMKDNTNVPGGFVLFEIISFDKKILDAYVDSIIYYLLKYKMSSMFTFDNVLEKRKVDLLQKEVNSALTTVLGVDMLHEEFCNTLCHCTMIEDSSSTYMITVTGLPEIIIFMIERFRKLIASQSNSNNGIIPHMWSLHCHTQPYVMISLTPDCEEWKQAVKAGRWEQTMKGRKITHIYRVENVTLYRAYCNKKEHLIRTCGIDNEKMLWHGTRTLSPEVIIKEGFDFRVSNAGSFGRGAYFAVNASYSASGYQYNRKLVSTMKINNPYGSNMHNPLTAGFGGALPYTGGLHTQPINMNNAIVGSANAIYAGFTNPPPIQPPAKKARVKRSHKNSVAASAASAAASTNSDVASTTSTTNVADTNTFSMPPNSTGSALKYPVVRNPNSGIIVPHNRALKYPVVCNPNSGLIVPHSVIAGATPTAMTATAPAFAAPNMYANAPFSNVNAWGQVNAVAASSTVLAGEDSSCVIINKENRNALGANQIILAQVSLGRSYDFKQNPTLSGNSLTRPPEGFDSVFGQDIMHIVYDLSQAYPTYIFTYD